MFYYVLYLIQKDKGINKPVPKKESTMTSQDLKLSLQNPATSYWLLEQIKKADTRDALDMARDADILNTYCRMRLEETELSYMEAK